MAQENKLQKGTFAVWPRSLCRGLPKDEQLILIHIWAYANEDGVCWPSISRLCQDSSMSRSTVQRVLGRLIAKGILKKEQRKREDGSTSSNCYYVTTGDVTLTREGVSDRPTKNISSKNKKDPNVSCEGVDNGGTMVGRKEDDKINYEPCVKVWAEKIGVVQHGRFKRAVKPVIQAVGPERAATALASYVAATESKYVSPEGFASRYKAFLKPDDNNDAMLKYVKG